MGIKNLMKFISEHAPKAVKEVTFNTYTGRVVAIDASMCLYQFLIAIRDSNNYAVGLTNDAGETTSHLQGFVSRTIKMIEAGIKPVYVFDGKPPELKLEELAERRAKKEEAVKLMEDAQKDGDDEAVKKLAGRTVRATKEMNEQVKKMLRMMGVPVIEAPSEAEASCAALVKYGKAYTAATEDLDCLTFGTPTLTRNLFFGDSQKRMILEVTLKTALEQLDCTMLEFIDFCILSGCDYADTIRGVGAETAFKLIKTHGTIEKVISEGLEGTKYKVPEGFRYAAAREIFHNIEVVDKDISVKPGTVDPEGLRKFLIDENQFDAARVEKYIERLTKAKGKATQQRLDCFFKITKTSVKDDEKFDPFAKKRKSTAKAKAKGGLKKAKKTIGKGAAASSAA